jgi:hypothetical protein
VRFYSSGQEVYLRIDGDLPVNSSNALVYARTSPDNEIWVALAEKAYAYYRYGQNSYSSIESGWMSTTYSQVTGGYTSSKITYNSTASSMYDYLRSKLSSGYAVTAGTYSGTDSPWVGGHAYVIKSVQTVGGQMMATIYNPWGIDGRSWDSNSSDGLMNVTIDSILDNCSAVVSSLV